MQLTRYSDVHAFSRRVLPFLVTHEAAHNLLLGLCVDVINHPERYTQPPYAALVEHDGQIVLVAMMTPPYNLTLSLCSYPAALEAVADDLLNFTPHPPGAGGPAQVSGMFAQIWQQRAGVQAHQHHSLRIFKITQVAPPAPVPGSMRRATDADRPVLGEWFQGFDRDALGQTNPAPVEPRLNSFLHSQVRGLYLWQRDDVPVAMAGYSGPTPNSIRIVAVYTPAEHRRQGYASALVATLTQHLLDGGRQFCTLFTDVANPTSNHIYQDIGYRPVIDAADWKFT